MISVLIAFLAFYCWLAAGTIVMSYYNEDWNAKRFVFWPIVIFQHKFGH